MELAPLQQAYRRRHFPAESTGGQYRGLGQDDEYNNENVPWEAEAPHTTHHHGPGRRSWTSSLLWQVPFLAWLAPIIFLLYLNLHGHVIGASAWCPKGNCKLDPFNGTASSVIQAQLARYDHEDHNLLGSLQLAAKALEIWFIFIAGCLVYNVTVILASRQPGLQLMYLTRPYQFADIPAMFEWVLWQALPSLHPLSRDHHVGSAGVYRGARWRVWVFVILTVLLGLLCNLVGPAVAVLVLPSLQWQSTPNVGNEIFASTGADNPPGSDSWVFQWCAPGQVQAEEYSCAKWNFALDGWLQSCISQGPLAQKTGITSQDRILFGINTTDQIDDQSKKRTDVVSWAPSRQLLRLIDQDLEMLLQIGQDKPRNETVVPDLYDTYLPYDDNVQTFIYRNGPVLGAVANMWVGYNDQSHFDTAIDQDTHVRCFKNYNLSHTPLYPSTATGNFTKCVPWGEGWKKNLKWSTFTIDGIYRPWLETGLGPSTTVDIFTSDRAAFLPNGTIPDGFDPKCLVNGTIADGTSCNWDLFFTSDPNLGPRSSNITTIHMTQVSAPYLQYPTTVSFAVDFVTCMGLGQYSFDPSPITNPFTFVTEPELPVEKSDQKQVLVDPAWILTAWGVDAGGTLGANGSSTLALQNVLGGLWAYYVDADHGDPIFDMRPSIDCAAMVPIAHALSLVDYTNVTISSGQSQENQPQPPLYRYARIYVWAYGISSRTAYFGVSITCLASAVVILQAVLAIKSRRKFYSPSQLLVAALEYKPSAEFAGIEHNEKMVAKVPFRVEAVEHAAGDFAFSRVD